MREWKAKVVSKGTIFATEWNFVLAHLFVTLSRPGSKNRWIKKADQRKNGKINSAAING